MKNFIIRAITSVFIIAVVVGAFLLRQLVDTRLMHILFYLFAVGGTLEMVRALGDKMTTFNKYVIVAVSLTLIPLYVFLGANAMAILAITAGVVILISMVFDFENTTLEKTGCAFLALVYPNLLLIPMVLTNEISNALIALILIFVIAPVTDGAAYIIGSLIKGPKLCEKVSPKKTISGAIGGLIGGTLASVIFWLVYAKGMVLSNQTAEFILFIVIGVLGSLFTELGDLIEGTIKRKLAIKDMGKLLPGHGGVLDRIDGNMICAVFVYGVFMFIG